MVRKFFLQNFLQQYLGIFFSIAIASSPALSQTIALPAAAQEAINKGIMATKVPDYLLAIRYFEDARKAAPQSPEVFFNLGLAESKIPGRELRAICWFGAYLAANPRAANAAAVKEQMDMLLIKNQSNLNGLIKSVQDAAALTTYPNAMPVVAVLWANTGDITSAIKAAGLSNNDNSYYKASAFKDIAKIQSESGDFDGAQKTAELIEVAQYKSQALMSLAESQFKAGDIARAKACIETCLKATELIKEFDNKSTAFNDIAKAQLKMHDTAGARSTLLLAQKAADQVDINSKPHYQKWNAETQILAGDLDNATKALLSAQKNIELHDDKYNDVLSPGFGMRDKISEQYSLIQFFIKLGLISNAQNALKSAQKFVNLLTNPNDKVEWQRYSDKGNEDIALALLEKGDIPGAKEMAEGIKSEGEQFQKNKILATIAIANAKLQAESGNIKGAIKSFETAQQAIDLAMGLPSYDYQRDELKRLISESQLTVANKLIKTNDLSGAKKIADIIKDGSANYSALDSIIKVQLLSGDFNEVQNTVELIKDNANKCHAQLEIAEAQIKSNDITGAKKTFEKTLNFSEKISEISKKVDVLLAITEVQLKVNDLDGIKINLQSIKNISENSQDSDKLKTIFYYKSSLLDSIIKLQLKAGDFASAFITADLNKYDYYKNGALTNIAVAYTMAGNLADAQKAIDKISETWHKSYAERDIAVVQVKNKDMPGANKSLEMAKNYAQLIKNSYNKSHAFSYLAEAQAKAGDLIGVKESISSATTAADSIEDPNYKLLRQVDAYSAIAEAQINTGDTTGANKILGIVQKIAEQEVDTGFYSHEWEYIKKVQQKAGIAVTARPKPLMALAKLEKDKQLALDKQASDKQLEKVNLWIKRLDDNSSYYDAALNTGSFLDITTELKSIPASDPNKYFDGLKNTADKMVKAQIFIEKMMKELGPE